MSNPSFTVSELNRYIRDVLTSGFPRAVWICGEIQGMRTDQKGHVYFELVENEGETHTVLAKIKANIWNTRRPFIESILKRVENGLTLKNDIQVKVLCKVDFWAKAGALSLTVENIDPTYTLGKIAQERQRLIALLEQSGTLAKNKLVAFPFVPLNIGLITSYDSAAYHDFTQELKLSGFAFKVFLCNSIMQGKDAEHSVCRALASLNKIQFLDLIVVVRGGGSIAELSCFDSQKIAEQIAASRLPVVSGIGHEINISITDLAAHSYAKTPTAVAQLLIGKTRDFLTGLEDTQNRLFELVTQKMEGERRRLRRCAMSLQGQTTGYLKTHHQQLNTYIEDIRRKPLQRLRDRGNGLGQSKSELFKIIHLRMQNAQIKISNVQKLIELASPIKTLKRGFSITRSSTGAVIKSIEQAKTGEELATELADGKLVSTIKAAQKEV